MSHWISHCLTIKHRGIKGAQWNEQTWQLYKKRAGVVVLMEKKRLLSEELNYKIPLKHTHTAYAYATLSPTGRGSRCHRALCRWYTPSSCRQLLVFFAAPIAAACVPAALVPMETQTIRPVCVCVCIWGCKCRRAEGCCANIPLSFSLQYLRPMRQKDSISRRMEKWEFTSIFSSSQIDTLFLFWPRVLCSRQNKMLK